MLGSTRASKLAAIGEEQKLLNSDKTKQVKNDVSIAHDVRLLALRRFGAGEWFNGPDRVLKLAVLWCLLFLSYGLLIAPSSRSYLHSVRPDLNYARLADLRIP